QNHRAKKCHNNRADHASTLPNSQKPEDPATQDAAEDAENDVNENTVATALHHLSSKPTCNQSNHNPCKKSHDDPPWVRLKHRRIKASCSSCNCQIWLVAPFIGR